MEESKRKRLVNEILACVRDGTLRDRLPSERELAVRFDVSRNILREAIVELECMGILESRGREGLFTRPPDFGLLARTLETLQIWPRDTMRQIMEMRTLTEVPAAGLAALRRTDEHVSLLRECVDSLRRIHGSGESWEGEGAHWDSLLHVTIVKAAGNELLVRVYEGLSVLIERYIGASRKSLFTLMEWPELILGQHVGIAEAVTEGNASEAERISREHIRRAIEEHMRLGVYSRTSPGTSVAED